MGFEAEDPEGAPGAGGGLHDPGSLPVISSSPVVTACYGRPRTCIQPAGHFSSGPRGLVAATGTALPQGFEGSGTEPSGSIVDGRGGIRPGPHGCFLIDTPDPETGSGLPGAEVRLWAGNVKPPPPRGGQSLRLRDPEPPAKAPEQALLPATWLWAVPTPRGVCSVRGAQALLSEAEWPRGWPAMGPALGGAFRLALEARFGGAPPPHPDLASAAPSPALERSRLPGFANSSAVVVPVRAHPGGGLALLVSLRPGVPDGTCCAVRRCDPRTPREPPELGPFSCPSLPWGPIGLPCTRGLLHPNLPPSGLLGQDPSQTGCPAPSTVQRGPPPRRSAAGARAEEDVAVPGGGEPRWPLGQDPRQQQARVGASFLRTHREMSSVGPEGSLQGTCRSCVPGRTVAALAGRPCPSLLRPHSRPRCGDKQQATLAPAEPGDRSSWDRTLAEPPAPSAPGERAAAGAGGAQGGLRFGLRGSWGRSWPGSRGHRWAAGAEGPRGTGRALAWGPHALASPQCPPWGTVRPRKAQRCRLGRRTEAASSHAEGTEGLPRAAQHGLPSTAHPGQQPAQAELGTPGCHRVAGLAAGPRGGSAPSLQPLFVLASGAPGPVCRLSSTVAALPRQLTGLFPPHSPHHRQACAPGAAHAGLPGESGLVDQWLSLGPPGLLLRAGARNLRVAPRKQYSEPAPRKPQMLPEAQLAAAEMMTGATASRPPVTDTSCRPSAARAGPPLQASPPPRRAPSRWSGSPRQPGQLLWPRGLAGREPAGSEVNHPESWVAGAGGGGPGKGNSSGSLDVTGFLEEASEEWAGGAGGSTGAHGGRLGCEAHPGRWREVGARLDGRPSRSFWDTSWKAQEPGLQQLRWGAGSEGSGCERPSGSSGVGLGQAGVRRGLSPGLAWPENVGPVANL
ncbi:unnamed protein product [Nyctereutes procyonoides]|uniref:(raccoon dog) hypothetical protein n=1 Tax=Nyctereutes procyonoides TaxID=34880 RepID=A0A811ZDG8_NYCPR|nr:unnamed protein product [Nyctereutes procyonoides]